MIRSASLNLIHVSLPLSAASTATVPVDVASGQRECNRVQQIFVNFARIVFAPPRSAEIGPSGLSSGARFDGVARVGDASPEWVGDARIAVVGVCDWRWCAHSGWQLVPGHDGFLTDGDDGRSGEG